nr:adaptin ear-binding coat-associated protein 2 [Cryptococcus depauperatus CBS 7841]
MNSLPDGIEAVLYVAREVMVYQVPPQTTTAGYKASEWNVESFLWKGRLRVVDLGSKSEIRLEDSTTGELFAQVNYVSPWNQVEPVLDSSRYFVLRVEGEGGKRAYIGLGFEERGEAFDFQASGCVALQSIVKRTQNIPDPSESSKPAAPPKDYSLKEGQTFKINIPGRSTKKHFSANESANTGGSLFSLPPPPPPGRRN